MFRAAGVLLLVAVAAQAGFLELFGVQNCANKCNKVFDRSQYAIANQPNSDTFEFRSCIIGCNQCTKILQTIPTVPPTIASPHVPSSSSVELADAKATPSCFGFCKTFNYGGNGIRKGLIEPDKACIMGCVINTCQEVCTGGTTDNSVTAQNSFLWWGLDGSSGCSIKSGGGYVQNPGYGNPDAPGGEGGSQGLKGCCANAFNLCNYNGDKDSLNYQNVELVTQRTCSGFINQSDLGNNTAICDFFNTPQNCGTVGLGT